MDKSISDKERVEILGKVRKLMAFTEGSGATQGEIENAASLARKLLDKYQLSLSEVALDGLGESLLREDLELEMPDWLVALLNAVVLGNDCRMVSMKAGRANSKGVAIFGYSSDVEVALFTFTVVARELQRLAREAMVLQGKRTKTFFRDFMLGAAYSLSERFRALRAEASSATTALVVSKKEGVNKAMREAFPFLSQGRAVQTRNAAAWAAGRTAGSSVPLQQGIRSGGSANAPLRIEDKR